MGLTIGNRIEIAVGSGVRRNSSLNMDTPLDENTILNENEVIQPE